MNGTFVGAEPIDLFFERGLLLAVAWLPRVFTDTEHTSRLENARARLKRDALVDDVVEGVVKQHRVERLELEVHGLDGGFMEDDVGRRRQPIVRRSPFDALASDGDEVGRRLDTVDVVAEEHQKLAHPPGSAPDFEDTAAVANIHRAHEVHDRVGLEIELLVPGTVVVGFAVQPVELQPGHRAHVIARGVEEGFFFSLGALAQETFVWIRHRARGCDGILALR